VGSAGQTTQGTEEYKCVIQRAKYAKSVRTMIFYNELRKMDKGDAKIKLMGKRLFQIESERPKN
jgi:hypothetical protein